MNNIINFGSISRCNVRYNASIASIKYIKNVLINIAESLAAEYSTETAELITAHVTDAYLKHVITQDEINKRSTEMILNDIFDELNQAGVYSGDKAGMIATILASLELYQDTNSRDSSVFDTVSFNEVFATMLTTNYHPVLIPEIEKQIIDIPRALISYVKGNHVNYPLTGYQLLDVYEKAERSYVAGLVNPGTYIDFESHQDNAKYTVLGSRAITEEVDMSLYGEGIVEVSRKKMDYYSEHFLFDVRSNPSPEQIAHTSNLRKVNEYGKVHNVIGLNEIITVILSIDLRTEVTEPVDIINLTGRSKSQMALMLHPDRLVLELDCFDVDKSIWVFDRVATVPILHIAVTFDNGNVRLAHYDSNGDLVVNEIVQETRSYFENIFYLFICPIVGTYKYGCVRIGKVEIYGDDISNEQIEALLNQRGANQ